MMNYDLEERREKFSREIISQCKSLKLDSINKPIINQLIRSATSIGANYREANGASSKKDFRNKVHICKKEAKETTYWISLLKHSEPNLNLSKIATEANELMLIFSKIAKSSE